MLKLSLRRFSIAVLSAAVGLSSAAATAQLTERVAPPRKDTTRSNDEKPAADSRAGGALSVDADPIEGAEVVDEADINAEATDGDTEPRVRPRAGFVPDDDALEATFSGLVTGVSEDQITVQMGPPRVPRATEQIFKVSTRTPIVINGQKSELGAVKKGQFVRIMAMPGDPGAAARIVVATPPRNVNGNSNRGANAQRTASGQGNRPPRSEPAVAVTPNPQSEDEDRNFDVFPDRESAPARGDDGDNRARGRMAHGNEEAVLPLGIEVYGPGEGALVTEMLAQGPASRSGVQIGDYITQVNHKPIGDPEAIERLMADNGNENGAVILTLMRNGEQMEVTVEPEAVADGSLTGQAITAALEQYGIAVPVDGGVITPIAGGVATPVAGGALTSGAVAGGAVGFPLGAPVSDFEGGGALLGGQPGQLIRGLQPNDVITAANGQPIQTGDDLIRALQSGAENFSLTVNRNGQVRTVSIPRSAMIQAATQRTGAQRATGTLSGTTGTGGSGPLQRATGTLNGTVGTDQGVNDALNGNNNVVPVVGPQRGVSNQNTPAAAQAAAAARAAAAQRNAVAPGAGATGGAVTGGAAAGGAATGGAATGGAATGGAATGGTTTPR